MSVYDGALYVIDDSGEAEGIKQEAKRNLSILRYYGSYESSSKMLGMLCITAAMLTRLALQVSKLEERLKACETKISEQ